MGIGDLLRNGAEPRIQGMRGHRPDDELVRCCRSDPEALEALYRRHVRRLTLYAASRCARPEDVADLVAATFVAAMESAHRFDPARGEALPWLIGIARHLAADASSRGAAGARRAGAVVGQRSLDPDEIAELEDRIDATRQRAELEAALKQLSVGDREALWLVGPLGLSGVQAAQALSDVPGRVSYASDESPSLAAQSPQALVPAFKHTSSRRRRRYERIRSALSKVEQRLLDELLAYRADAAG